ncbi:TRAM domain-containing protein, partial [bacterium]|nr:TRAM domain-containing protein [bacterium]
EIKFDMAYIARYSPRPGTQAEKMKDNVSDKEKRRREKELTKILRKTILARNKKFIGKTIEVLAEKGKNNYIYGKSRHFKTVRFKGDKSFIGNFVKIKITKVQPFGLEGKISS